MLRKLVTILAAAGLTLGAASLAGATASASPASPSYTSACPAKITHPNIALHVDSQYVGYARVQTCNAVYAYWKVIGPSSWDSGGVIGWTGLMSATYYAWLWDVGGHLGKYTLQPDFAIDSNGSDVAQATETFYIKSRSHTSISGYRSGHWVYARAYVSRYSPYANDWLGGYVKNPNRYVTFWHWYSGAWHKAGYKWTGSTGWTGYLKIWAPTSRSFKVYAAQNAKRWGAHSATIYR